MEAYKLRVVHEQDILDEKIKALYSFLASKQFDALDSENKFLLKQQYYAMQVYSGILLQRIVLFK